MATVRPSGASIASRDAPQVTERLPSDPLEERAEALVRSSRYSSYYAFGREILLSQRGRA
jgi:hypothetical protein